MYCNKCYSKIQLNDKQYNEVMKDKVIVCPKCKAKLKFNDLILVEKKERNFKNKFEFLMKKRENKSRMMFIISIGSIFTFQALYALYLFIHYAFHLI